MMWGMIGGGPWRFMPWGFPLGWLFWAAVAVAAVWWWRRHRAGVDQPPATPLEIAKRRLAQGEIDADQYEEIRAHLQG